MSKEITIKPQQINKTIKAPASKSVMQRVIACAVLSENEIAVSNPSFCDDCKAALKIAKNLGARILTEENKIIVIPGKNTVQSNINCGESGLSVRMFSAILPHFGNKFTVNGKGSLQNRPVDMIENALKQIGLKCETNNGFLPLNISGNIKAGNIEIDGSVSSQVLTGLLISLPKAKKNSIIKVKNLKSKPYIDLTLRILNEFGIEISNYDYKEFHIKGNQKFARKNYTVEGDWSGAAFLIVAGLIAGKTEITGLNLQSEQADIQIIDAVKKANGNISLTKNSVIAEKSKLQAFEFDATDSPDLFPPLVTMAAYSEGITSIKGVNRLIYKESNRAETLQKEFGKLGIEITLQNDYMKIKGGNVKGGNVNSHNDHRIAMACAVAALGAESEVIIKNPNCVNKSFPDFYEILFREFQKVSNSL